MQIIGAGIAGLLAGNMLSPKQPTIVEEQATLPNNHSAVLRFRSRVVGDVTGIEFRKVQVIKASLPWRNPIADALAYSDKSTGVLLSDRSIPTAVTSSERYIAPADLINRLAAGLDINFGIRADGFHGHHAEPTISTIPMPTLMSLLDYPERVPFYHIGGVNIRAKVETCNAYVSLYVPNRFYPFSRVSLTGDDLIVEVPRVDVVEDVEECAAAAAFLLGIERERIYDVSSIAQRYAKIQSIDDGVRKRFIAYATDKYNIYSLGRYATWRPTLLLDDLVQDIRLISRWMGDGGYAVRKHR